MPRNRKRHHRLAYVLLGVLVLALAMGWWVQASIHEMATGEHAFPWSAYAFCGTSEPENLPATVKIGLYEEFPVPWRLDKLAQVDFPVTVALAAPTRAEFDTLQSQVVAQYPQVREFYFWPTLSRAEGYYPGAWSDATAVQRAADESTDIPTLWDLELPLGKESYSIQDWWRNRGTIDAWLKQHKEPVQIWRSFPSMGLDPLFLRLIGMQFAPSDYPNLTLQLNLYTVGDGLPDDELYRILRCGVEQYGSRFVPAFGSLNDGEGPEDVFVPVDTFRRYLQVARRAGVAEIWLFGVNGLNPDYVAALHDTLPLESLSP